MGDWKSGRDEGDGREEGVPTPLETIRTLLLVVEDRVVSALWWSLSKLSKLVNKQDRSQMVSVSSSQTIEKD